MINAYSIDTLRISKEDFPTKKSFINLDDNHLGFQVDTILGGVRFIIYGARKRDIVMITKWMPMIDNVLLYRSSLQALVKSYYKKHDRLVAGSVPEYTKIALAIYAQHLSFHIQSGSLSRILEKERIY